MMISIGGKHFIENKYIVEILNVSDTRAARIARTAAQSGRLINATGGRRIRSIIKLKSKHTALSALRAENLKSRLGNSIISSAPRNSDVLSRKQKSKDLKESNPPEYDNRRIETDRRRFSYTHHIPERRGGAKRRSKDRR